MLYAPNLPRVQERSPQCIFVTSRHDSSSSATRYSTGMIGIFPHVVWRWLQTTNLPPDDVVVRVETMLRLQAGALRIPPEVREWNRTRGGRIKGLNRIKHAAENPVSDFGGAVAGRMLELYMTVARVAARSGLDPWTVSRQLHHGDLPKEP